MNENPSAGSPPWGNTTKLIVSLALLAILAGLLIRFQYIWGPLLVAIILAYLIHPVANFIKKRLHFSWRLAVLVPYLLLVVVLLGLLTWGGISLVEQIQNLVIFLQNFVENLPALMESITAKPVTIGPFVLDFGRLDFSNLWTQVQGIVEPALSKAGSLVGTLASGAASTVTWSLFSLIISFFLLAESGGFRDRMILLPIPHYAEDFKRLGHELSRIWNAFLRGQLIMFTITVLLYTVLLGALGLRYFVGLALLAGFARFVPYVGPWITWITYGLVAFFQGPTLFGMPPGYYVLVAVGIPLLTDSILDNFVSTRIMADALKVHPAAVLIAVLVAASLFGLVGVLLSAPVLASAKLLTGYIGRKLMDMDPWEGYSTTAGTRPESKFVKALLKLAESIKLLIEKLRYRKKPRN